MPLLPETIANITLMGFGVFLTYVSLIMVFRPNLALAALRKMASTPLINLTELGIRALIGWAFISYAEASNAPDVFRIIGWFLMITAAIIICVPRRLHHGYSVFWANRLSPKAVQVCSLFSFAAVLALTLARF